MKSDYVIGRSRLVPRLERTWLAGGQGRLIPNEAQLRTGLDAHDVTRTDSIFVTVPKAYRYFNTRFPTHYLLPS